MGAFTIERKRVLNNSFQNEYELHKWTVNLLRRTGYSYTLWFHVPNGEKRDDRTTGKLTAMGVLPGIADLQIFVREKPHFLELKHGKNDLTDRQYTFKCFCDSHGIPYKVARNQDQVAEILTSWGAIRPAPLHGGVG
jgi:hypothetical protein